MAKVALTLGNAFLSISETLTPLLPLLFKFATLKIGLGVTSFFRGFGSSFKAGGGVGGAGGALGRGLTGTGGGGGGGLGSPASTGALQAGLKQLNVGLTLATKSITSNTGALAANTRLLVNLAGRLQSLGRGGDQNQLRASILQLNTSVLGLKTNIGVSAGVIRTAAIAEQQSSKAVVRTMLVLVTHILTLETKLIANTGAMALTTKSMGQLILALRANAAAQGDEALLVAVRTLTGNIQLNARAVAQASIVRQQSSKAEVRTMLVLVRHLIILEAKILSLSTTAGLLTTGMTTLLGRVTLNTAATAANTRAMASLGARFTVLSAGIQSIVKSNVTLILALQKAATQIRSSGGGSFGSKGGVGRLRRRRGGFVPGSGSGDTVPALLEPGEFVIRKSAAQAFGAGNLHKVNKFQVGRQVLRRPGRQPRKTDRVRRGVGAERKGAAFGGGGKDQTTEVKALGLLKTTDAKIDALPEDDRLWRSIFKSRGCQSPT